MAGLIIFVAAVVVIWGFAVWRLYIRRHRYIMEMPDEKFPLDPYVQILSALPGTCEEISTKTQIHILEVAGYIVALKKIGRVQAGGKIKNRHNKMVTVWVDPRGKHR